MTYCDKHFADLEGWKQNLMYSLSTEVNPNRDRLTWNWNT